MFCYVCSQTLPNNEIMVMCCHCNQSICLHCFTSGVKQQYPNYVCCLCKNNYTINYIYNIISSHTRFSYVIDDIKHKVFNTMQANVHSQSNQNNQNNQNNQSNQNNQTNKRELFNLITIINPYNCLEEVSNLFTKYSVQKSKFDDKNKLFCMLFDSIQSVQKYNNVITILTEFKNNLNKFINIKNPSLIEFLHMFNNNQTNITELNELKSKTFRMYLAIEYKYYSFLGLTNLLIRINHSLTKFNKVLQTMTKNQTKYSSDFLQKRMIKIIHIIEQYHADYVSYFINCGIHNCIRR